MRRSLHSVPSSVQIRVRVGVRTTAVRPESGFGFNQRAVPLHAARRRSAKRDAEESEPRRDSTRRQMYLVDGCARVVARLRSSEVLVVARAGGGTAATETSVGSAQLVHRTLNVTSLLPFLQWSHTVMQRNERVKDVVQSHCPDLH